MSPLTGKPIIDHVYLIKPLPEVAEHQTTSNGVENGDCNGAENGEIPVAADQEEAHEDTVGDIKWEWAKKRMNDIINECGLAAEEGVDRVVEASGAGDSMLHGVAICKEGGICKFLVEPFTLSVHVNTGTSSRGIELMLRFLQYRSTGRAWTYTDTCLPHDCGDQ